MGPRERRSAGPRAAGGAVWRAPAERRGAMGAPRATPLGGPAGRSPRVLARRGRARRSGAGRWGPRERRRWGVRRGEAPGFWRAVWRAPASGAGRWGPASAAAGGSGGAKPPGVLARRVARPGEAERGDGAPRAPPLGGPAGRSPPEDMTLSREFYARPTLGVSRELIGKVLVHESPAGLTSGVIVEVEAYIGEEDPACHAAPGPTARNAPLYGQPGFAYVYLNYGIHNLVNAVTEEEGSPAAILIRALEPLEGEALMRRRRARGTGRPAAEFDSTELCRGPGNLTRALGITLRHNRMDLTASALRIEDRGLPARDVIWSRRIGINVGTEMEWRCAARDSQSVSGGRVR